MSAEEVQRVLEAVVAAASPSASDEVRRLAAQYSEQLKGGDSAVSVRMASQLVELSNPLQAQHLGYGVLHHLVKTRWGSFGQAEQLNLYQMGFSLLQQVSANRAAWPVRAKAALLLAEIARQGGGQVWDAMLPALMSLAEGGSPGSAAAAIMVLRNVTEDVTVYADDLQADQKRSVLNFLNASVESILPFVVSLLERHFTAAVEAARAGERGAAEQHSVVVQEGLEAAGVFAAVMPINQIYKLRVIDAAAFLLHNDDFKEQSLDVLRKVVVRKAAADESATIAAVGNALIGGAAPLLDDPTAYAEIATGGQLEDFGQRLCDTMVEFGIMHFEVLTESSTRNEFLRQMIRFTQHPDLRVSGIALQMWNSIMGKSQAVKNRQQQQGGGAGEAGAALPEEAVQMLVDSVMAPMATVVQAEFVPDSFMSRKEFKEFCSTHRAKLSKLLKDAASVQPSAVVRVCTRQLQAALAGGGTVALEVAALALEAGVQALPEAWLAAPGGGLAELLRALLDTPPQQDTTRAVLHGRCLEAMAPYLKCHGEMMEEVISKLITMMLSVPLMNADGWELPPLSPPKGWRDAFSARTKIAGNVLGLGKVAGQQLAQHLQPLSSHIQALWDRRELRIGERNVLHEALLLASANIGPQVQAQLLEWLLAPLRRSWAEKRVTVTTTAAFLREYVGLPSASPAAAGQMAIGGREARWVLFHEVQQLERTLRRMPPVPPLVEDGSGPAAPPSLPPDHPFLPHISWAFDLPLLLLPCLHSLWSPEGREALARGGCEGALEMSPAERQVYLGQPAGRQAREAGGESEEEESTGGGSVKALRMWLKGTRESLYQAISMAVQHVPGIFSSATLATQLPAALLFDLQSMEAQHVRLMLRHGLLMLVRECPRAAWDLWLPGLLPPLLPPLHSRLTAYWAAFVAPSQLAGAASTEDSGRAQDEVVEERIMRELSREATVLIGLLTGLQRWGHVSGSLGPKQVDVPGSNGRGSHLEWLLGAAPGCAQAVVSLALAALSWPDSDSAHRAMGACRVIVAMASDHPALQQVVAYDMLRGAIHGLTLSSNTIFQGDLITLIREILVKCMASSTATQGVLLSLPGMQQATLTDFYNSFSAENSEKEQRLMIKRLLVGLGGGQLKALEEWRTQSTHAGSGAHLLNQTPSAARTANAAAGGDGFELSVDWTDIARPTINN